uniref:Uncharacterized protein n=1 Tax=Trichuris muris TaxID=70415 RepID=A0A5S6QGU1_TRIMR
MENAEKAEILGHPLEYAQSCKARMGHRSVSSGTTCQLRKLSVDIRLGGSATCATALRPMEGGPKRRNWIIKVRVPDPPRQGHLEETATQLDSVHLHFDPKVAMAKNNQQAANAALVEILEDDSQPSTSKSQKAVAYRRVIIMRHGERCDDVYGDFVQRGFVDGSHTFRQFDLNMPEKLPQRHEDVNMSKMDWQTDAPLSNMGHKTAAAIGAEYAHLAVSIEHVFSSPALRCVQTAGRFIEGFQKVNKTEALKVKIEGGLYEWQFNTGSPIPRFFAEQDLARGGLPIDLTYKCFKHGSAIPYNETFDEFNQRCVDTVRHIMQTIPTGSTVLFITHAPNFDMFNRYRGTGGMPIYRWQKLINRVPYLHAIVYDEVRKNHWEMRPPPVCSFPYEANAVYNWENPGKP